MKKQFSILAATIAAAFSISAHAADAGFTANIGAGYQQGSHSGTVNSAINSVTIGGSSASGNVWGTGQSIQHSAVAGNANSYAGGTISPTGVTNFTGGGSESHATNTGNHSNAGYGQSAGGVGSDFASHANGVFNSTQTGGFASISAFGNLGAFSTF